MQTVKGVLLVLVLAFAGLVTSTLMADGWANVIGFLFIASMLRGRQ